MAIPNSLLRQLLRVPGTLGLWEKRQWGDIATRVRYGALSRPHYGYGVFAAADLAKKLGLEAISVLELGVAGGNGLVALEKISAEVANYFGIKIHVYGFDTGAGMPAASDYRDLPHVWQQGFYKMDVDALKRRLQTAQLRLGNVENTIPSFVREDIAPIGFIAFDLDYYSSTKVAFGLFKGSPETRLPRVYCYMDDVIWPEYACHNDHVGELLAIKEFNDENETLKICPLNLLRHMRSEPFPWNEQIYVMHDFLHPFYTKNITSMEPTSREIPLTA